MMKLSSHCIDEKSIKLINKVFVTVQTSLGGFLNMAIDKFIFENFEKLTNEKAIFVRFYTFANHTVTLGYFQNNIDQEIKNMYKKWAFVKRITGGKAVFHYPKKDLTLCVVGSVDIIKDNTKHENISFQNMIKSIHKIFNELLWNSITQTIDIENINIENINFYEDKTQNKLTKFDCFKNVQAFEKEFNGKKVIGTAIKISQFSNNPYNHKFILQANIKLQNICPELNLPIKNKIIQNFLDHFDKIYHIEIKDLVNQFKKRLLLPATLGR
ncbi:MAG: lipoyl protein ligase domain-containing protein [bacterium]